MKHLINLWRATDKPPFGLDLPWTWRDIGKVYGLIVIVCCIFNIGLVANQSGFFATSTGNSYPGQADDPFVLWVKDTGETIYKDVPAKVGEALAAYLLDTTFETPERAVEAVEPVPGNPAYAHAVNICTHSSGKVSNQTGGGRHLSRFDGHRDGRHHTDTYHQVLQQSGYVTYDHFHYSVSRGYCGC